MSDTLRVGKDWIGWSEDVLTNADVIVHMVGGYTEQRTMAAERLVQESLRLKSQALHITVNPVEEDIPLLTPGMVTLKVIQQKKLSTLGKIQIF